MTSHYDPDNLLTHLGDGWTVCETTAAGATVFTHTDGHRIGIRPQGGGATLQTWITAGPSLPALPDNGTPEEQATARADNDARLQPGRTWHKTLASSKTDDLQQALLLALTQDLLPALAAKPRQALTLTWDAEPAQPTDKQPTTAKKKDKKK